MIKNQTPVVFTGDAGDYFGIWIVNLMLSILTLGIYSAWAKVRRKKYFYNNTLVDGVGFDYHANPIAILKGRIIAVVLFVLYMVLSGLNPALGLALALTLFLAIPWIVVRGMMFNARNTSHRGLRFDFDGKTGQAVWVFIAYPLLIVLTLGLAMPFVAQRTNKFLFDHHKFGLSHFQMNALVKDFYMVYLKLLGLLIVIGIVVAIAIKSLTSGLAPAPTPVSLNQPQYLQTTTAPAQRSGFIKVASTAAAPDAPSVDTEQQLTPEQAAQIEAEMKKLTDTLSPEQAAQVEAEMKKLTEPTAQTDSGNDKTATPTTKKDPVEEAIEKYMTQYGALFFVMFFGALLLYISVIFLIVAYMQSRIANLVFNNTTLDHVGFFSNQRMRSLVWLYLSNIMLLMFTGGLATPWAQIRMARYRAEHLAITGETDWDKFIGEKKESSRAMGEEIADMFDIDLSFG